MDLLHKLAKTLNQITNDDVNNILYMRPPAKVEKSIESVDSFLMKAKPARPGEKRQHKDGVYEKQQDGSWVKVKTQAQGKPSGQQKKETPSATAGKQWQGGKAKWDNLEQKDKIKYLIENGRSEEEATKLSGKKFSELPEGIVSRIAGETSTEKPEESKFEKKYSKAEQTAIGVISGGKFKQLKDRGLTVKPTSETGDEDAETKSEAIGILSGGKFRQLKDAGLTVVSESTEKPAGDKIDLSDESQKEKNKQSIIDLFGGGDQQTAEEKLVSTILDTKIPDDIVDRRIEYLKFLRGK